MSDKVKYTFKYAAGTLLRRKSTGAYGYECDYDWPLHPADAARVYFYEAPYVMYMGAEFIDVDDIEPVVRIPIVEKGMTGFLPVPSVEEVMEYVEVTREDVSVRGFTAYATVKATIGARHVPEELRTNLASCPYHSGIITEDFHAETWEVRGLKSGSPKRIERQNEAERICKLALPGVRERVVKMTALKFLDCVKTYNERRREKLIEAAGRTSSYDFEVTPEMKAAEEDIEAAQKALNVARQRLRDERQRQALADWTKDAERGVIPQDLLPEVVDAIMKSEAFAHVARR